MLNLSSSNMSTGVSLSCRQRLLCHLVFLVISKLHESSSTYRPPHGCDEYKLHESSLTYRPPHGCVEYPKVCKDEVPAHNNCTTTLENQICHYSLNDSLQQCDLLSLFGQPNDIPKSPNNFSVSVNYIEDCSGSRPTLKFSWKMPSDEESMKWLTGFVLNISYAYNNKNRQRVLIFFVENKPSKDAIFKYECFRAMPGVRYRATIYSLPTDLQNIDVQTISVSCSIPYVKEPIVWRATIDVSVLSNGSISIYFMPAPNNFRFSGYRVWLSTRSGSCIKSITYKLTLASLCPEQGNLVLNTTGIGIDIHKDFTVCVKPENCVRCWITAFNVSSLVVPASLTEETTKKPNEIVLTTDLNPGGALPVEAIVLTLVLVLLFVVVLLVIIMSQRSRRIRSHCHKNGVNAKKKFVFFIYGDEVKPFINLINRLSDFLKLCNHCEVISGDGCSSERVLKKRIAFADSVLIISSADPDSLSGEGSNLPKDSETASVSDRPIFDSAIKVIKKNFQTGVSYMKFCQIILPCCDGRRAEVSLLDLKIKKTYHLMEFIEELWEDTKKMSSTSDSKVDDIRKCYEEFKDLNRSADSTNSCLKQCSDCRNDTFQRVYERTVFKKSSNNSGIAVDDNSAYFLAEALSPQCCCSGLSDTKPQMADSNSHCYVMCRSAAEMTKCSHLDIESQYDSGLQSTTQCNLLQCSKKDIDLDDYLGLLGSRDSSSDAMSLSSFNLKAVKFNYDYDRNLEADGLDDDRAIRIY